MSGNRRGAFAPGLRARIVRLGAAVFLVVAAGGCGEDLTAGKDLGGATRDLGMDDSARSPDLAQAAQDANPDLAPMAEPPSTTWISEGGGSVSGGAFEIEFTIAGSEIAGQFSADTGATISVGGICSAVE